MLSAQVIEESLIIEEVFLAKVTPGMRKNLGLSLGTNIAMINVVSKPGCLIQSLLSNEYQSPF